MTDALLSPVSQSALTDALTDALALRFAGRKRKHDAGKFLAKLVARPLVERLERADFEVIWKPPAVRVSTLERGDRTLEVGQRPCCGIAQKNFGTDAADATSGRKLLETPPERRKSSYAGE